MLLAACLLVWPAVFATVVLATFLGVAIYFNDPGGPLFWPLAWIGSALAYALVVGLPLSLCARRRRWYLRLIPAVLAAVPVVWISSLAGVWSIPAAATVAVSILVETTGWRHKWTMRVWRLLTALWRRS
ncbi:hypothetical protein [Glycomyces arizonensis]|uniref:hypothetical protein n=1 Tax=Glycomyces arizonensis TaxID=256035 RepID=UPI0012EB5999|nr:hypothetical protein [Glycomyces arizonensis]